MAGEDSIQMLFGAAASGSLEHMRSLNEQYLCRENVSDMLKVALTHLRGRPPSVDQSPQYIMDRQTKLALESLTLLANAVNISEELCGSAIWINSKAIWHWIRRILFVLNRYHLIERDSSHSRITERHVQVLESIARIVSWLIKRLRSGPTPLDPAQYFPGFPDVYCVLLTAELCNGKHWRMADIVHILDAGNKESVFDAFIAVFDSWKDADSAVVAILKEVQKLASEALDLPDAMRRLSCITGILQRTQVTSTFNRYLMALDGNLRTIIGALKAITPRPEDDYSDTVETSAKQNVSLDAWTWAIQDLMVYIRRVFVHDDGQTFRDHVLPAVRLGIIPALTAAYSFAEYQLRNEAVGKDGWSRCLRTLHETFASLLTFLLHRSCLRPIEKAISKSNMETNCVQSNCWLWIHFQDILNMQVNLRDAMDAKRRCNNIHCEILHTPEAPLKRCKRCQNREYCSVTCQREDWNESHRQECFYNAEKTLHKNKRFFHGFLAFSLPKLCTEKLKKNGKDHTEPGVNKQNVVKVDLRTLPWTIEEVSVNEYIRTEKLVEAKKSWVLECANNGSQLLHFSALIKGCYPSEGCLAVPRDW